MSRAFRIIAIVCFCVIAFSIFYYFVIFLPLEKRAERADSMKKAENARLYLKEKQDQYNNCMKTAREAYVSNWDDTCKLYRKPADCPLPRIHSERLDKIKRDKEDRCLRELEAFVPR